MKLRKYPENQIGCTKGTWTFFRWFFNKDYPYIRCKITIPVFLIHVSVFYVVSYWICIFHIYLFFGIFLAICLVFWVLQRSSWVLDLWRIALNCIFVDVGWFEFDYWFTQRVKDNPRLNVKFKVNADVEGQQLLKKYVGSTDVLYLANLNFFVMPQSLCLETMETTHWYIINL